jgi:magnesium-transporting ATPase (P-type)
VFGGDKILADLRIIQSDDLRANNISITGDMADFKMETHDNSVEISEAKNIGRSGSNFTQGSGLAIVIQTGDNTFFGKISHSTL